MNKKNITQSMLAAEMGLSRNTISNAFTGNAGVSGDLREKIVKKADEMGYVFKNQKQQAKAAPREYKTISLVNQYSMSTDAFWNMFTAGLERELRAGNYLLNMCMFENEDQNRLRIPEALHNGVEGIILAGVYTDEYLRKILDLGLPTVMVDANVNADINHINADIIAMENRSGTYEIVRHMISLGHKKIGFYGEIYVCASYNERWQGYCLAMEEAGLGPDRERSILPDATGRYTGYDVLEKGLDGITDMPTAFLCCNDNRAIDLIKSLRRRGYEIPGDISVAGFDDVRESTIIDPPLTTVHCYREEMGTRTAKQIMWRIENKEAPFEMVTLQTKVIRRDSIVNVKTASS